MSTFEDLLQHRSEELPGETQRRAREALARTLTSSHLEPWKPADASPTDTVLVIGAATWSRYDLRLLDVLNSLDANHVGDLRIVVFDIDSQPPEDLRQVIPYEGRLVMSPLVGFWREGKFIESAQGFRGRQMAYRVLNVDVKEAEEFVGRKPTPVTA